MITVPELAAEALESHLAEHKGRRFGSADAGLIEPVQSAARLAVDCIGNSDALYHNVEHTMLVTLAGYDILRGRRLVTETNVSERDHGTLSRSDFRWDRWRSVYICPNGKALHTTGKVHEGKTLRYLASKFDCDVCAFKMQRCPNSPSRPIPRDVHEYARDVTRRLMRTKAFLKSRDQRKRVEMRFAHLKIHHGFERMRLRGLSGARDEFLLAATVQNLKTLALRILGPPSARRRLSSA
jgi:hypothetical protein